MYTGGIPHLYILGKHQICIFPNINKEDKPLPTNQITISKKYIKPYTVFQHLDQYDDFTIVIFILCQDMYDNRTLYVDKTNLNKVVETILGMHTVGNIC